MDVVLVCNTMKDLNKYLDGKSGIRIIQTFSNLYSVKEKLYRTITRGDRLLYMCTQETENFTRDLNIISRLLKDYSETFKFEEMIFFVQNCTQTREFPNLIDKVMYEHNQSYSVPISQFKITYDAAYSVLLGRTDKALNKESRERVYIKPRNTTTKEVYEKDSKKTVLEPFNYDTINKYDELKRISIQADNGKVIQDDNKNEINLTEKFPNPYLGEYKFQQNLGEKNIILITGEPANGTTTYLNTLASSALIAGKKPLIINMTDSGNYANYIDELGSRKIGCIEYSVSDMLLKSSLNTKSGIASITLHDISREARIDGLRYFLKHGDKTNADYIFIELPRETLIEIAKLVRHRLHTIFYVIEGVKLTLQSRIELFKTISEEYNLNVWINNHSRIRYQEDILSYGEIKEILPGKIDVCKEIIVDDYDVSEKIFNSLVEVESDEYRAT